MQIFIRTLILGIASGSIYALASTGLVLTYKTSGVLNFGYGALALFTTYIHYTLAVSLGWPVWLSAVIVVGVVAPLIGVFLDVQLFRRIEGQPQVIGVIATVGLFVLFRGLVQLIWGGTSHSVPSLFPPGTVHLPGGTVIGKDQLGVLIVAVVAALGLGAMLRYTKMGVAFRAVVSNRQVAGLMGINTGFVSGLAWAIGCAFAALTGVLLTPILLLDPNYLPPFIIAFVLGAAIVGYMRSLPLAYAGGIFIGIAQAIFIQYIRSQGLLGRISDSLPFIMITLAVVFAPRALRLAGAGASFIVRTREVVGHTSKNARAMVGLGVFALLALVPAVLSLSWSNALLIGLTQAVVFLSLVILTGYSGQISLGQTAFMGIAGFAAAHAVQGWHVPIWLAIFIGGIAAVPAGNLIGFIAVRVHGLYLALMTLAFAFMVDSLFFQNPTISGGEGGIALPRPGGFTSDRSFYFVVLGFLILFSIIAVNLRTGRTGRVLAAMRDSETASRSLGIGVTKYKVLIFGLSAFMAGVGGVLYGMILQQAGSRTYIPFLGLFFMTIAVVGGIFQVGGAIAGGVLTGLYLKLTDYWPFLNKIQLILFGLGATLALAQNPEGLFGELRRAGAAITRMANRRSAQPRETAPLPVAGGQE
jgi:branched-subunit amino acid ABC-type transport system permease component